MPAGNNAKYLIAVYIMNMSFLNCFPAYAPVENCIFVDIN